MRNRRMTLVICALVLLPLAACETKPDAETANTATGSATTDRSADADAIKALGEKWLAWATSKNVDSLMTLYVPDAKSFLAGQKPITDAEGRRNAYNEFVAMNLRNARMNNMAVEFSDDGTLAYDYGTYAGTLTVGGRDINDEGSYLNVWRRTPDGWRMVAEMSHSSMPMGPPPTAPAKR